MKRIMILFLLGAMVLMGIAQTTDRWYIFRIRRICMAIRMVRMWFGLNPGLLRRRTISTI